MLCCLLWAWAGARACHRRVSSWFNSNILILFRLCCPVMMGLTGVWYSHTEDVTDISDMVKLVGGGMLSRMFRRCQYLHYAVQCYCSRSTFTWTNSYKWERTQPISLCNFINNCTALLLFLSLITEKLGANHQQPRSSLHVLSWDLVELAWVWLVSPMQNAYNKPYIVFGSGGRCAAELTFHLRPMTGSNTPLYCWWMGIFYWASQHYQPLPSQCRLQTSLQAGIIEENLF